MSFKPITILKRCKSECDVAQCYIGTGDDESRRRRESSVSESSSTEVYIVNDSATGSEDEGEKDVLDMLEKKMDRLSDLFLEQCHLLTEIKEDICSSKDVIEKSEQVQNKFIGDLLKNSLEESPSAKQLQPADEVFSSRARILLDAIETRHTFSLERELKDALSNCLQSEEFKEQMVRATVVSVRDMVRDSFSYDVSRLYVPVLQRATRRLARLLTRVLEDEFAELEAHSSQLSDSMCRLSRSLRRALQRHEVFLQSGGDRLSYVRYIIQETLEKEIKEWRRFALDALEPEPRDDISQWAERGATPPPLEYPPSPPQPADPNRSIIDQLMMAAEINKQIQDGNINAAFESALSAADLSLVMAACRACEPSRVFTPCRLEQSTLLSLAQQLPTDMVHETLLKCRFLEEALINLNPMHPSTQAHLPLVVADIRKNLTTFLAKFPSHIARRRITLIMMAADNLLK